MPTSHKTALLAEERREIHQEERLEILQLKLVTAPHGTCLAAGRPQGPGKAVQWRLLPHFIPQLEICITQQLHNNMRHLVPAQKPGLKLLNVAKMSEATCSTIFVSKETELY